MEKRVASPGSRDEQLQMLEKEMNTKWGICDHLPNI